MMNIAAQNDLRSDGFNAIVSDTVMDLSLELPLEYRLANLYRPLFRSAFLLPAPAADVFVEKHKGVKLYWSADGYHGSAGIAVHFGYCDTLDQLREEVADYMAGEAEEAARLWGDHRDTPSIDTSFHDHEMEDDFDDGTGGVARDVHGRPYGDDGRPVWGTIR